MKTKLTCELAELRNALTAIQEAFTAVAEKIQAIEEKLEAIEAEEEAESKVETEAKAEVIETNDDEVSRIYHQIMENGYPYYPPAVKYSHHDKARAVFTPIDSYSLNAILAYRLVREWSDENRHKYENIAVIAIDYIPEFEKDNRNLTSLVHINKAIKL